VWLVIGLGNPGHRYAGTRHNVGFRVVDALVSRWGLPAPKDQLGAKVTSGAAGDERVVLAMPQAFMNCSGQPAASVRGWYRVTNENVVVIHDDMDLPFGQVRVRRGGGHGGHNGLRDLHQHLGPDYARVRVGVSRPPPEWDPADYVLSPWSITEQASVAEVIDRAVEAVEVVLHAGVETAMNRFNVRPGRGRTAREGSEEAAGSNDPSRPAGGT